jgi:hypothetical protein
MNEATRWFLESSQLSSAFGLHENRCLRKAPHVAFIRQEQIEVMDRGALYIFHVWGILLILLVFPKKMSALVLEVGHDHFLTLTNSTDLSTSEETTDLEATR